MTYTPPKTLKGPNRFSASIESFGAHYRDDQPPCFIISLLTHEGRHYTLEFDESEPSDRIIQKALLFFRHDPDWREHFSSEPPTQYWKSGGEEDIVAYDPLSASYFDALGITPMSYNKGSLHPHGSACELALYGRFPDTLLRIAASNGWLLSDNRIRVNVPRGFSHLGHQSFTLLLDDWLSDSLDTSGERYNVGRDPKPLFPEWPGYPLTALQENETVNQQKAKRINRFVNLATFDHYARLTSGRDVYSNMELDELIKRLGSDDPALIKLNDVADNPRMFAKSLRWRLRGLNVMHTLEKYRVDDILHNYAENVRKKRREELYPGSTDCFASI
jgi:hypothetical protein